MSAPPILNKACEVLAGYQVVFCDVWGVVHDGRTAYADGCTALARFRECGGTVILVSNAPRTAKAVTGILAEKGVPPDCWDAIVSSGDLALAHAQAEGIKCVHHIGPDRDLDLFDAVPVERVPMSDAEALLCTGLIRDRTETAEHYRPQLDEARRAELPLICANPDLVVDVGGDLLPCAGSIATLYEQIGGGVYWAGKPYAPAYEAASRRAEILRGKTVDKSQILAIGDAVRTDIAGAQAFGIDALFIGQGIHRDAVMSDGAIKPDSLSQLFSPDAPKAVAAMAGLVW
jgi:HAD superfamily hydrolase (TIGR01459 family)